MDRALDVSTYVLRATVADDAAMKQLMEAAEAHDQVIGVFADPRISTCRICPGDPPMGDDTKVAELLSVSALHTKGLDGSGVHMVVVDTGFNLDYLRAKGKTPEFDAAASWSPRPTDTPGNLPKNHGTMCAYDVCITAPKCTLIDHALLRTRERGGSAMDGFLSDAVKSYGLLLGLMGSDDANYDTLVVTNSWAMFHPSWDFPQGHLSNYSDNPQHPFNIVVASLEVAGADILFAAGNCGADCSDGRCEGVTERTIYGANSHDAVTCVAGVDVSKDRVGYSSQGPGRLVDHKPDVAAYTHFSGSGVYPADGGTSAACPVAAGVVAAIRTKYPSSQIRPTVLRNLMRRTAEDRGKQGFDYDYGFGIINPRELLNAIEGLNG